MLWAMIVTNCIYDEPHVCNSYAAGAIEQARNITQHKSMRITTLDPVFAPASGSITENPLGPVADEDERDPSRYFIVYETGDNTTTSEGKPEPDDLFYSRAVNFGDDYLVWAHDEASEMTTDLSWAWQQRMPVIPRNLRAASGSTTGVYEILESLAPETWYNIWVMVDTDTDTYQVWMNSGAGSAADSGDQLDNESGETVLAFRNSRTSDLLNFFIKTGSGNSPVNGGLYLDVLYLENTDTVNPSYPLPPTDGDSNGMVFLTKMPLPLALTPMIRMQTPTMTDKAMLSKLVAMSLHHWTAMLIESLMHLRLESQQRMQA
jgi:hypothetical protein